jgi:hypothetical protein
MRIPRRRLLLAVAIVAMGCRKQAEQPHGSPSLIAVLWEVGGVPSLVWSPDADAAVAPVASAAGSRVSFVFDRSLDGARIEDTVNGTPTPKANPPITVSWPDMATTMSDPPFAGDVFYNSLPDWGTGTSYAFVRPRIAGFPSSTPVTFSLDPNGLTSVYGDPMVGPATITVTTTPLTVALQASTAIVSTSYMAPIAFSTRAPAGQALTPFVHVSTGGVTLPFEIVGDVGDAQRVYILAAGCLGGWPPDARIDITIDAGLTDGFGRPLAAGVQGSFMTSRIGRPPVDGGCPFDGGSPDAGSLDADTADAGAEADAPVDGVDAIDAQSN